MSTRTGLADLLFGRTRGAILALLYGHADRSFYTRQIAREVNASVGAVQRELENLSKVLLIDGLDTTSAAYEVGYESVSQFSREYSRFFGQPPLRDFKALRDSNVAAINVA